MMLILETLQMTIYRTFPGKIQIKLQNPQNKLLFLCFNRLKNNLLIGNAGKCRFLVSSSEKISVKANNYKIENSNSEKVLFVKFSNRLTFYEHVSDLCIKSSPRIYVQVRVTPFMNIFKRCILLDSFLKAQFNYCPLIRMFHSRENDDIINRLHGKD